LPASRIQRAITSGYILRSDVCGTTTAITI
jgi:hypothetical protein